MKTSWIIWWIVTVFWIITFAGMSLAILIRKVDGSGMVQSPEARMYALIVLLIAYIIPFIIQIVWLIINIIVKYRKR
ncbi:MULTISPECIES: DUF3923 family protein [Staphylococcus]|jgi:glucan phosphoethanolaminetransferase (alkaline phosphatase superfamily)|uniref:DUF3923 family protein n=1 Tax=Staphylococcus lugdunensis TaxID=28035 RepID=A0ABD4EGL8_STALU|nr:MULTISPECIES: DUF3923 family protein [Staphylococcus]AMG64475.1 DUF3923 domain-containing protein [Staphylococcus lugdunensis]ARB78679.1 DUF3923 domain-containing protein [Staphylococcus lugdunensis]ARJ07856.1 hypothetical protein B7454_00275 [Staphylococcus lugdunensis]ARJ14916.1 hypothetical protein B7468_11510 [Staphylococcus lugdunensis]ARJ17255.1 hypothetical protein B6N54_11805 [Staphylococcus lugdunensis]